MTCYPNDDELEVREGVASEYGEASGEERLAIPYPCSYFDELQRRKSLRRKPAGPPLPDQPLLDDGEEV